MVSYAAKMSSWQVMRLKMGGKAPTPMPYATSLKTICKNEKLHAWWFSTTTDFRGIMVKYKIYYQIMHVCIHVRIYVSGKSIEQAS